MSMTTVANPSIPGPPRQPHTINDAPNQTMAINPYPLTPAPPYGRLESYLLGQTARLLCEMSLKIRRRSR